MGDEWLSRMLGQHSALSEQERLDTWRPMVSPGKVTLTSRLKGMKRKTKQPTKAFATVTPSPDQDATPADLYDGYESVLEYAVAQGLAVIDVEGVPIVVRRGDLIPPRFEHNAVDIAPGQRRLTRGERGSDRRRRAPAWEDDYASFVAVWTRLAELGYLSADAAPAALSGIEPLHREAIHDAIARFQAEHQEDIEEYRQDAIWMRGAYRGQAHRVGNAAAGRVSSGEMRANDATHQALMNAWPRSLFGIPLEDEARAFYVLGLLVQARGLPWDAEKVNVVAIRGVQGGHFHGTVGAGLENSRYDDTMFVCVIDDTGAPRVREFRGTTEPGGRGGYREERDPNTQIMDADQQVVYRFGNASSAKAGRPMFGPRTATGDDAPAVVAPHRDDEEPLRRRDRDRNNRLRNAANLATDPDGTTHATHDRLRTRRTVSGEALDRNFGIAIHSGGRGDQVDAWSTGCQVIHTDWYGGFIMAIRRGLAWVHERHPELDISLADDGLARTGHVLYSLLDGAALHEEITRARSRLFARPHLVRGNWREQESEPR